MKFLITGCGRSGTAFISKALHLAGCNATHETLFNPVVHSWPDKYVGVEASWLAAPYLHTLPADVRVFHQLRNPLAVIRSLLGFRFFERPESENYRKFLFLHEPSIQERPTPLDRCLAYWLLWNLRVQKYATAQYRLEDLTPKKLQELLMQGGAAVPYEKLTASFKRIGTQYNHRNRMDISGATILARPLGPIVERLANTYGYARLE